MKTNRYVMATVMVAMALVVGAAVFVDTDSSDADTALTPVTVDEVIEIGPESTLPLNLDGNDITFTGDGKYVIKSGGTLSIGSGTSLMYTQFQLSGAGEVIVLEPGAIVEIMGSPTTISSETVVDLDGTLSVFVSLNFVTMSVDIKVDIQKDDVLSIAGFTLVGGSSNELYVKVSAATSTSTDITATMTIDAPKFTIPEVAGVTSDIVMESVSMDLKVVMGEEAIAVTGTTSEKATANIGNMTFTLKATPDMPFDIVMNSGSVVTEMSGSGSLSAFDFQMKSVVASSTAKIMDGDKVIGDSQAVNAVSTVGVSLAIDSTAGLTDMDVVINSTVEQSIADMTYTMDGVEVSVDQTLEDGVFQIEASMDGNVSMEFSVGSYSAEFSSKDKDVSVSGTIGMTGLSIEAVAVLDMDAIMGSIPDLSPDTTPDTTPDVTPALAYEVVPGFNPDALPSIDPSIIKSADIDVVLAGFDMDMTVTQGNETATVDLGIQNLDVCMKVDGNLDGSVTVSLDAISADVASDDGKTDTALVVSVTDIDAVVNMGMNGLSEVTVTIGSITAAGDVPVGTTDVDSVDITATGLKLVAVPPEDVEVQPSLLEVATVKGTIGMDGDAVAVDGNGISAKMEEGKQTVKMNALTVDLGVPQDTFQSSKFVADKFEVTIVNDDMSFKGKLTMTMVRPDGSTASMTLENVNGKDTCTYKGYLAEDELYITPMDGVSIVLDKTYVDYVNLDTIDDVSGDFYLGYTGSVTYNSGQLFNMSNGVSIHVTVDGSIITGATLVLDEGYTSIPSHSEGIEYRVSADQKTAVLSGYDGNVIVDANGRTYEITAGSEVIHVEIGEKATIPAPAQGPTNLTFFGWTDGVVLVKHGEAYTHNVPFDIVMQPVWVGSSAVLQGDNLVFDVKAGNGIVVNDLTTLGSDYLNADVIIVNTQNGDIRIPVSNTLAGPVYNDIEASIVVIDAPNAQVASAIDGATLYNVSSNVYGTDFTLRYALGGADVDSVKLYAVNEYGVVKNVTEYDIKVVDGTATITFDPMDSGIYDAVGFYVDAEGGSSSPEPEEGGLNIAFIAGAVVGILIVAAVVIFLVKRKP